jgi:hypothetical protein
MIVIDIYLTHWVMENTKCSATLKLNIPNFNKVPNFNENETVNKNISYIKPMYTEDSIFTVIKVINKTITIASININSLPYKRNKIE